jgi:SNF2 family DNA or RNA helicase
VCQKVWPDEIKKWDNFKHLSHVVVCDPQEKNRRRRISMPVDIHILNRDAVGWLADAIATTKRLPWDLIIIDESSSFRNWGSARTKAMKRLIARIPYRVILTGTPAPRNYVDLFPQMFLLDEGQALGTTITEFRSKYCFEVKMEIKLQEENGVKKFGKFKVKNAAYGQVQSAINHLCLRLDARDYLSMPPITYHDIVVELPPEARRVYDELEREMFVCLQSGDEKLIANAAALYVACKQVASGGLYDNERKAHGIHSAKTEAVTDLLQELGGKPAMIAYQFDHELDRLRKAIPKMKAIRGGLKKDEFERIVDAWNMDTLDPPYLAVHPMALSYGVNMQEGSGRDMIWYGIPDNLELYIQLNARIWRQGVSSAVRVHRIIAEDTVDELIRDRTDQKFDLQADLLQALRSYAITKGVAVPTMR